MEPTPAVRSQEPTPAPVRVAIGRDGREVELVEPPSLFAMSVGRTREEAEVEGHPGALARGAAALRACWPSNAAWPCRETPRPWRIGQDVVQYGAEIWEALRRETKGRVSVGVLRDACLSAYNYAAGHAYTEAEVSELSRFSDAQGEGEG